VQAFWWVWVNRKAEDEEEAYREIQQQVTTKAQATFVVEVDIDPCPRFSVARCACGRARTSQTHS
jgi:hypothetical protein